MEVKAIAKYVRVQPRKVRIVADQVTGKPAAQSAQVLQFHSSKGAMMLRKVLVSAIANAVENHSADPAMLKIARISVDEGPRAKRVEQRAMGRGNRIVKKTAHITVVLEDYVPQGAIRPHGTKAKPRPTFAVPKKGRKPADVTPKAAEAPVSDDVTTEEEATEAVATETAVAEAPVEATNDTPAEAPVAEADATKD